MMTARSMPSLLAIAQAVGSVSNLTDDERRAILEIAYCVVVADQHVHDAEREALRMIARKLASPTQSMPDIDDDTTALLARLEAAGDREVQTARLNRVAAQLTTPESRTTAYKIACALAQADEDASDGEFEMDLDLISALDLSQPEADRLLEEVTRTLRGI